MLLFILISAGPIARKRFIKERRISESSYDFVPTRLAFSLKSVFVDNQAARELVCGIGSMQRRRMTLHDSLRICDACKTDMELQAKAKMILFASKLDCAFRVYWNYRLEFSKLY